MSLTETEHGAATRVVYGVHAVREALRTRRNQVSALLLQKGADGVGSSLGGPLAPLLEDARKAGITPIEQPRGELDRMSEGGVHQGVVAICGEYVYATVAGILSRAAATGAPPLVLLLDGVTDPQNLGALVRSVHVLGGHGVIMPQDRAASVTASVVKASAGATELLAIARVPNLVRAMGELKEAGLWLVAATAGEKVQPPWGLDLRGPTGLVLGSEGKGLRPLVRKTCDLHVEVPMAAGLQGASLNVSNAGAILLYEALRQRANPA